MNNAKAVLKCIQILKSSTCLCGLIKQERKVFCLRCFTALPQTMRDNLYLEINKGFEDAVEVAILYLKKRGFIKQEETDE